MSGNENDDDSACCEATIDFSGFGVTFNTYQSLVVSIANSWFMVKPRWKALAHKIYCFPFPWSWLKTKLLSKRREWSSCKLWAQPVPFRFLGIYEGLEREAQELHIPVVSALWNTAQLAEQERNCSSATGSEPKICLRFNLRFFF